MRKHGPVKGLKNALIRIQALAEEFGTDSSEVKFFIKEYKEREHDERAHILIQAMFTFCLAEDESWFDKEEKEQ